MHVYLVYAQQLVCFLQYFISYSDVIAVNTTTYTDSIQRDTDIRIKIPIAETLPWLWQKNVVRLGPLRPPETLPLYYEPMTPLRMVELPALNDCISLLMYSLPPSNRQ